MSRAFWHEIETVSRDIWRQDHFECCMIAKGWQSPHPSVLHTRSPVSRVPKYNRCITQCVGPFSQWLATAERRKCIRDKLVMAAAWNGCVTRASQHRLSCRHTKATLLASRVCKAATGATYFKLALSRRDSRPTPDGSSPHTEEASHGITT